METHFRLNVKILNELIKQINIVTLFVIILTETNLLFYNQPVLLLGKKEL